MSRNVKQELTYGNLQAVARNIQDKLREEINETICINISPGNPHMVSYEQFVFNINITEPQRLEDRLFIVSVDENGVAHMDFYGEELIEVDYSTSFSPMHHMIDFVDKFLEKVRPVIQDKFRGISLAKQEAESEPEAEPKPVDPMIAEQINQIAQAIIAAYNKGEALPRVTVEAIEGCHTIAKFYGFKCNVPPPQEAIKLLEGTDGRPREELPKKDQPKPVNPPPPFSHVQGDVDDIADDDIADDDIADDDISDDDIADDEARSSIGSF